MCFFFFTFRRAIFASSRAAAFLRARKSLPVVNCFSCFMGRGFLEARFSTEFGEEYRSAGR